MEIYVTTDFEKTVLGTFLRKPSLADSYYLNKGTAISEAHYYVDFHINKGNFTCVNYFEHPVETDSYIVLGCYTWNLRLIYFGVAKEYLIER